MKKLIILQSILLLTALNSQAQTFWTENFTGGSTGLQVGSYTSVNGAWSNNTLGTEGASPNIWYVSCTEAGKSSGTCGAPCVTGDFGESLHLGSNPGVTGDVGAAYFTGGCFSYTYYGIPYSYGICAATDRRAESPVINCTGKTGIKLSYYYIENGDGAIDNGTVWYYSGTAWSLLEDPTKSTICGGTQGQWAKRTVALPSSADNNPNVKIGFRWVNDEDGFGADPSFAVDSVSLSTVAVAPVASYTATGTSVCQDSCITFTSTSTGTIDSIRWVAVIAGFPVLLPNTNPLKLCFTSSLVPAGSAAIRLRVYGAGTADSSSTTITINPAPHPGAITRVGHVLTAATGTYTGYQWYNTTGAIAGATSKTYTFPVAGTYSVVVDSAGCKGTATIVVSTAGISSLNEVANNYWVVPSGANTITIHAAAVVDDALSVTIYDATGRQVVNERWSTGSNTTQVNVSAFNPGLYTIKLSNAGTSELLKWVKQ